MKKRKWPYTEDELILVLDAYFSEIPEKKTDPKVIELAELVSPHSPESVELQLKNFRFLDPDREGGARNYSKTKAKPVWDKFAKDRDRLESEARVIRKLAKEAQGAAWSPEVDEASEGRVRIRAHISRERNSKLIEQKKRSEKKKGRLVCEACRFDFARNYLTRGEGFIECHHKKPLSELKPGTETKLSDLALLCSNCHRMIHLKQPWLTMEELKNLVHEAQSRSCLREGR